MELSFLFECVFVHVVYDFNEWFTPSPLNEVKLMWVQELMFI